MVDEYQDVNYAQYRLCSLLSQEHKNITVVGDDDQSIYSWRGSDYKMILRFEQDFPGAAVFRLEENYRSTQTILDAANELVANNTNRSEKKLFTNRDAGEPLTVFPAETERPKRATSSRRSKSSSARARHTATSSVSIVRMHSRAYSKKASFPKAIPYRVVGGVGFYDRTEVKDMMA